MSYSSRAHVETFSVVLFALAALVNVNIPAIAENSAQIIRPPADATSPTSATISTTNLGFGEIVFVKRKPYSSDHYYTDINNGTSPDRFLPENGIYIYSVRTEQERPVVTAADLPGGKGFVGKISLSFDAEKILSLG